MVWGDIVLVAPAGRAGVPRFRAGLGSPRLRGSYVTRSEYLLLLRYGEGEAWGMPNRMRDRVAVERDRVGEDSRPGFGGSGGRVVSKQGGRAARSEGAAWGRERRRSFGERPASCH